MKSGSPTPPTSTPSPPPKPKKKKAITTGIAFIAALINPKGKEAGNENITILNQTDASVKLDGWYISNKPKKKQMLDGLTIKANEILTIKISKLRLANSGGTITLFNYDDKKVHEVKYTKKDASKNGWTTRF